MSNLLPIAKTQIAQLPEVTAVVVTDEAGALIESIGDVDGEALGAVHVVAAQAITRCGNALGLGSLERITVVSDKRACSISFHEREILGVYLDGTKPIDAFEKQLEAALGR